MILARKDASNDSSLIIWLIQSYVPQILFEIYSCASKQGFSTGRNLFLWDNCNTMINIVFSWRVKGKRIILIGHPATNGYIIIPLDNEVLHCVFVCLCVCVCVSVCLSMFVTMFVRTISLWRTGATQIIYCRYIFWDEYLCKLCFTYPWRHRRRDKVTKYTKYVEFWNLRQYLG